MRRVSLFHFSLVNILFSHGLLLTDTLQVKESGLETPPTEANSELTSTLPTFAQ